MVNYKHLQDRKISIQSSLRTFDRVTSWTRGSRERLEHDFVQRLNIAKHRRSFLFLPLKCGTKCGTNAVGNY